MLQPKVNTAFYWSLNKHSILLYTVCDITESSHNAMETTANYCENISQWYTVSYEVKHCRKCRNV